MEDKRREMMQGYDRLIASKEEVAKEVTTLRKGTKMRVRLETQDEGVEHHTLFDHRRSSCHGFCYYV